MSRPSLFHSPAQAVGRALPGRRAGSGNRTAKRAALCRLAPFLPLILPLTLAASPAQANNYGESLAWQFQTASDRANQAAILDLIQKRRGGYYAAPIYNTSIARQINCTIAANATGNSDAQSAVANSPSVTGASAAATGNASGTSIDAGRAGATSDTQQTNSGHVTSGVTGATQTSVQGAARQALNAVQSNSGNQSASVQGSNACAFAALN
ncbi:hypothetical protein BH10PSE14_BH10PSE14_43320 [soil metagenome]